MTGIVGVVAHDRRFPVVDEDVVALADAYEALRGVGQRHVAGVGDYIRLIKLDTVTADRPGFERKEANWAAVTGVIHTSNTLIGVDLERLDGQFALARYDAHRDELEVATDPFGMHPLYVAERNGKTYISSSALALAGCLGAQPNRLGLAVLLCCGLQFGPITSWEGIERVEPATVLTFNAKGCQSTTYWRLEVDDSVARMGYTQVVDHTIEVLTDTFRRYLLGRPRPWADLTGGYDSRLLTLILREAGIDFRANTVGAPQTPDVQIARRIAKVAGWDWTRLRVAPDWPEVAPSMVTPALAWADGRLPVLHLAQVLLTHERKSVTHRLLLTGGGGEIFRGYSWRQEFFRAGRSTKVRYDNLISMRFMKSASASIMMPHHVAAVYEYLHSQLLTHAQPYSSSLNTTQLDILMAYRKAAWDGIFGAAAGAYLQSALPFFFKPAFGTGISIHHRFRDHHRLMRSMIERLDPRVAAIPTTSGGPAQPWRLANLHRFAPYYGILARAAINKLTQKALGSGVLTTPASEDPRTGAGRLAVLRRLALTSATMQSSSFYKQSALATFLHRAEASDFPDGDLLGRILTAELTMRVGLVP